jgi:hypothetical protein
MLAAVPAVANAAVTSPDNPDFCGLSAEGAEFGSEERGDVRDHESAGYWSVSSPNAEADKVWWYADGTFTDVTSQDPNAGSRLYLDKKDPGPITVFYLVDDAWQYIHAASVDPEEGPDFTALEPCADTCDSFGDAARFTETGGVRDHKSAEFWSVDSPNSEADKVWWYADGTFTDVTSQDPNAGSRLYLDKNDQGPITVFYLVDDAWQYIHAATVDPEKGPTFGDLPSCTPPPSGDGGAAPGDDGPTDSVTEEVSDGGTVSTDPNGTGPTADATVTTSVTTPNGGTVAIELREPTDAEAPADGLVQLGLVADIDAPAATANEPLQLAFSLHSSIVPADVAPANLITFRNGVPVPACSGATGIAEPDPCVALAEVDVNGNIDIEVLTSNASVWSFAAATSACPTGIVPADGFSDDTGLHGRAIACVVWWQLANGFGDGTFGASQTLTRAQGATFIARLLDAAGVDLPENASHPFVDVDGSVHETAISQLSTLDIISGVADDRFAPHVSLSRAQIAALLVRTYEHVGGALPAGADAFDDDNGSVHEAAINKAAAAGFTTGVTSGSFDPHGEVSRGQMASFLARVLDRFFTDGEVMLPH